MLKTFISTAALVFSCAALIAGAGQQIIRPPGTKPGGNFSPGILVDGTYISGQGSEDGNGKIPGTFDAEVLQSLDNIGAVLKAAGMSPADVVSVQVYLTNGENFQRMNAVYTKFFQDPRPTRTTVVVAKLGRRHDRDHGHGKKALACALTVELSRRRVVELVAGRERAGKQRLSRLPSLHV